MANRLNGNTPIWLAIISVVGIAIGLHYNSLARTESASDCAQEAKEIAMSVEVREGAHFEAIISRLDRIEKKLD